MKKLISVIAILCLVLSFAGCANDPADSDSTTNITTTTETTPPTVKPSLTDYNVAAMANVTNVYLAGKDSSGVYCRVGSHGVDTATAILMDLMCPYCGAEAFDLVDVSQISENLIGQPAFTWTGEVLCSNWNNHSDPFTSNFNYSVILTLNG